MKKFIMITLSLLMVAFAATAWAETVTISDTDKTFEFTGSPSTDLHVATDDTSFFIATASTKTTTDNGMEYCMISTDGNLYQKTQEANNVVDTDGAVTGGVPTDPTTIDYTVRGGS